MSDTNKVETVERKPELREDEEARRGEMIAEVLGLKRRQDGWTTPRYNTQWGTKTAMGLFRVVQRIVIDGV